MARRLSAGAVIIYFSGEEGSEVLFDSSDDKLGMEDEEPYDDEPPFEPLEVNDLQLSKVVCTCCKILCMQNDKCLYILYNMSKHVYVYAQCRCQPSLQRSLQRQVEYIHTWRCMYIHETRLL